MFRARVCRDYGDVLYLASGSNILGRGQQTGIKHPACSRKQVEVFVDGVNKKVLLTCHGNNPIVWFKKDGTTKIVKQNDKIELSDGDSFSLKGDKYLHKLQTRVENVELSDDEEEEVEQAEVKKAKASKGSKVGMPAEKRKFESIATKFSGTPSPKKRPKLELKTVSTKPLTKTQKKAQGIIDSDGEDGMDYDKNDPFIDDGPIYDFDDDDFEPDQDDIEDDDLDFDTRPACKYGSACYRKNPDHLRRFKHPKKKQQTSTPPSKESGTNKIDKVSNILTGLPEFKSVDYSIIRNVVEN
eukprot:CAMPEP_0174254964 /NCGR_PEP_ID=MMETSP0439-20130205/4300_1 /TAXON_ID=0 /ORGANISM="Stereomyxa ramosa, Strain Chinc5" /LENGTH=297 /DNA_ID=CAMNT_0015336879 /DNA_START=379 /DNA_END=1269 /DNA_ORIENTATION=+